MTRALLASSVLLPGLLATLVGCMTTAEDDANIGSGGGGGAGAFGGSGGGGGGGNQEPTNADVAEGSRAGGHQKEKPETAKSEVDSELVACKNDVGFDTFYMSADDSNSMASPVLAREMLRASLAPPAARIRTYEFLNYYNAHYEQPPAGTLGVHVEMQDAKLSPTVPDSRYRLQIGVQAPQIERAPLVVTFVVDASSSLIGQGIERERATLLALGHALEQGDVVNVVTWANENSVLLEGYEATGTEADDAKLAEVVNALAPGGGSDLHAGLTRGYDLAREHFEPKGLNRVVLLSDGGANLGVVDRNAIAKAAEDAEEERIYLVGVGVGPAEGYSDALMDLVTDAGRGAYVYLDDPAEADSVFADRFDEVMNIAAHDVQIQVDLPSYLEIDEFYGEKYAPNADQVKPQTLAPGDSMILNQSVYTTDSLNVCGLDVIMVTVSWKTALTHEERSTGPLEFTMGEILHPPSPQVLKANAVIAYAEALKDGKKPALQKAEELARGTGKELGDGDLVDIADLIVLHPAMAQ